jgi:hypothetical protein
LLSFEGVLTTVDVPFGPLLHLARVVARIINVLLTELAFHGDLHPA